MRLRFTLLASLALLAAVALVACPIDGRARTGRALGTVSADLSGATAANAETSGNEATAPAVDPNDPYGRNTTLSPTAGKRSEPHKAVWDFLKALQVQSWRRVHEVLAPNSPLSSPPTAEFGLTDQSLDATWSAWRCSIGLFQSIYPIYRRPGMPENQVYARLEPPPGANAVVIFTLQDEGPDADGVADWRIVTYEQRWGSDKVVAPRANVELLHDAPIKGVNVWNMIQEYRDARDVPHDALLDLGSQLGTALVRGRKIDAIAKMPLRADLHKFYPQVMAPALTFDWHKRLKDRAEDSIAQWIAVLESERSENRHARVERVFQVKDMKGPFAIAWLRFSIGPRRAAARATFGRVGERWFLFALDPREYTWPIGD